MQFGITIKPDISVERIVGLTRQAESAGFEYGWIFDSHVLWKEPYPLLTLMAANTQRMRLGTCVTNPATRDLTVTASLFATLNLISGGRKQASCDGKITRRRIGRACAQPHALRVDVIRVKIRIGTFHKTCESKIQPHLNPALSAWRVKPTMRCNNWFDRESELMAGPSLWRETVVKN